MTQPQRPHVKTVLQNTNCHQGWEWNVNKENGSLAYVQGTRTQKMGSHIDNLRKRTGLFLDFIVAGCPWILT